MIWVVGRFSGKRAGMPMRPKSTLHEICEESFDQVCGFQVLRGDNRQCAGFVAWLRTTGYASGWSSTLLGRDDAFQGNQKKGLTKQQERTLKKASTNSKKASLEQKTQYKVVAGDNQAESLISSVKLQLRRSNRVGRGSPKLAHVDQLAALRMLNAPGLSNLLTAVANYRKARCNQMGCSPKDFFNLDTDEKWLWE